MTTYQKISRIFDLKCSKLCCINCLKSFLNFQTKQNIARSRKVIRKLAPKLISFPGLTNERNKYRDGYTLFHSNAKNEFPIC